MTTTLDKIKPIFVRLMPPTLAMMPLSIAVIPWGVLCGTLAIEAGFSVIQAQLMSLLVFAGAVQIAGTAILGAGGSWFTLVNTTTMISVRHVLYSASYRDEVSQLSFAKRVLFAFLLTDEMFAVAQAHQAKHHRFDYWYAVIAGTTFYLSWNMATFVGIVAANSLGNIDELGFDFAICATFIAMVVPMLQSKAMVFAVLVSAVAALVFAFIGFAQGLIVSALLGMFIGAMMIR